MDPILIVYQFFQKEIARFRAKFEVTTEDHPALEKCNPLCLGIAGSSGRHSSRSWPFYEACQRRARGVIGGPLRKTEQVGLSAQEMALLGILRLM